MSRRVVTRASYLNQRAVARLGGVTPQRLRRYEEEGLIVGETILRGDREERLYQMTVVHRVRRIRSYEAIGVNLAGIEVILRLLEQRGRASRR